MDNLCRKLHATRVKTPNESFFIPNDQIEKFAEKSIIKSVINVNDREMLAEGVSKYCRRIFLILILMNRLDWLERLVELGLKDDSLPLQLDQDDETMFGISTSGERFDFPSDARIQDEVMFQTFQAWLTAPVFEGDRKFGQLLQKSQPLPYLELAIAGEKVAGKGFFSEVEKTRIHCAHLPEYPQSPGTNYVIVAIKRFTQSDEAWAEKDVANANTLQSPAYKSRHLTQAIATYTIQDGGKFIMLPWADGGHLDYYWESLGEAIYERRK
uniref:Uncharacterized protein n=1 Tax=Bionectria ochroleuca TaxID=29856 RepID=A0A8H7K5D5_BIOOC